MSLSSVSVTVPPTPTVSVSSTVNGDGVTELTVSWTFDPEVWGEITGNVNNVDLSCTSTTGSCVLSPVGCGEQHSIQVIVSNAAGSGAPTDSEVFTSCEYKKIVYSSDCAVIIC